ncbi:hypothetical protein BKA64DRAFT_634020 [Cadophora sp. MPI-SDFR-AT-0126]|nr:hypothetical protein BKA64DRAFT_634020 [Leotiomycetes sp. MPI-SDFR-AT-0126]
MSGADTADGADDNEVKFIFFPKMPLELRDNVWEKTLTARLVHWRPGGGKALAVFAVSKESRKATRLKYLLCHVPFLRHGQYSIFINVKLDTVYRHQYGLPNMVRQHNFPCEAIDIPSTLTTSVSIKADIFWNVQPWIPFLKSLTINLSAAAKSNVHSPRWIFSTTQPVAAGQTIWVKIKYMCPDLEELNILVGKSLDKDVELEELAEAGDDDEGRTDTEIVLIQAVRAQYQRFQHEGDLLGLKLRFVKQVNKGAAQMKAGADADASTIGSAVSCTEDYALVGVSAEVDAHATAEDEHWDKFGVQFDASANGCSLVTFLVHVEPNGNSWGILRLLFLLVEDSPDVFVLARKFLLGWAEQWTMIGLVWCSVRRLPDGMYQQ